VYFRALRLPFVTASIIPFLAGAGIKGADLNWTTLVLGVVSVAAVHLSANLLNDYEDSRSGADWGDNTYYKGLFGGSKLIQEGIVPERQYFLGAVLLGMIGAGCLVPIAVIQGNIWFLALFCVALFWGWAYSKPPFKLAYRRCGEVSIFILFGPVLVFAGYITQAGESVVRGESYRAIAFGVAYGLLTTCVLVANEVPDYAEDLRAGKRNLMNSIPLRYAWLVCGLFMLCFGATVTFLVITDVLRPPALLSLMNLIPGVGAGYIIKRKPAKKQSLVRASELVLTFQTIGAVILMCAVWT